MGTTGSNKSFFLIQTKWYSLTGFTVVSVFICFFYCICFIPIIDGDSSDFILLAREYSGQVSGIDQGSRGPVYLFILGFIYSLFGEKNLPEIVKWVQYLLVFVSSIFVFRSVSRLTSFKYIPFITGIAYLINFSTISYGYLILTESLTLFLFVLIVYFILDFLKTGKWSYLLLTGFLCSVLILTRFNTILIPLWILIIIFLQNFYLEKTFLIKRFLAKAILFILPVILLLNLWCLRNLYKFDKYFLFPKEAGGVTISLNGLYANVNNATIVSPEFLPLKKIILDEQNQLLTETTGNVKKGSLSGIFSFKRAIVFNNGFIIRARAYEKIRKYYLEERKGNLNDSLDAKLSAFHKQLEEYNRLSSLRIRTFSLISGLRASTGSLSQQYNNVNINKLPSVVLLFYRLIMLIVSVAAYTYLVFKCCKIILSKTLKANMDIFSLMILISYFPVMNFLFALTNDAARYKYPSEPFLIFLTIMVLFNLLMTFSRKRDALLTKEQILSV